MKIYLIDPKANAKTGHYKVYKDALLSIPDTDYLEYTTPLKGIRGKYLHQFIWAYDFIKQLKLVPKNSIAHFLFGGPYYAFSWLYFFDKRRKIIVTMHSCPEGKLKRFFLKKFCKKVTLIIVHSEYTKNQYNSFGIKNVEYIDYPSFYDYSRLESKELLRKKYQIPDNKIIFSALGATRFDKGLDILLNSFKYMKKEIKERIILNIAGKQNFFTEEFIAKAQVENDIDCKLTLQELTDEEFMENICISDYLVIPYRKSMTANSGPMTEGIINEIPCVVSDYGNIGTITKEKRIGVVFKSESPEDLAIVITNEVISPTIVDFSYKKNLMVANFIEKHKRIYNEYNCK
jgi:glycosyltransferase involved in cell wall biosynthesis